MSSLALRNMQGTVQNKSCTRTLSFLVAQNLQCSQSLCHGVQLSLVGVGAALSATVVSSMDHDRCYIYISVVTSQVPSVKPFFIFFCWTENWTGFRGTGQRSCIMGDVPDAPSSLSQPAIVRRRRRPKSDMQKKHTEIADIEDFVRNRK